MKIDENTKGVFIIAATPFTDADAIDYESIDSVTEFYIEKGVSGLTVLGMMGEAQKLSAEEQTAVMARYISAVDGQVPVIVGVSGAGLDNLATLSRASMDAGAAGVMVAPTPGLGTDERLFNYFSSVAEALGPDIPWCYQDYPQSTGVQISIPCLNRMIDAFANLVMFKHEDCPGLDKLSQLRASDVRRLSVLCGNGGLYLPQELSRGADGAMTGFAYPEMLVEVVRRFSDGELDGAEDLFDAYLPLVRYEQQPGFGLAVRKETLRRRGAISSAKTRAPGPSLSAVAQEELTRLMARLEQRLGDM